MENTIGIHCLELKQPIGTFYIGVISAKDLVAISYADVRRKDGRDIERYIGTQRDLSVARVKELQQYVTTVDACFPTSIILAISTEHAQYDEPSKTLKILKDENVAKIIDGQHRIAGLKEYQRDDFELNVTIFVDMDIEDQAMVFATINLKQTRVTKSLAYDLYEYAKGRSPQKTCHNIAKLLNYRESSPLKLRIKILGKAEGDGPELITQATFVDRLLRLISGTPSDAMNDKDDLKRNKKLSHIGAEEANTLVFRNLFIDEQDAKIAKVLWNYFAAVSERWPNAWNNFERGQILARTTGFAALMRFLPELLVKMRAVNQIPDIPDFLQYFKLAELADDAFTSDNYKPGSSGEGQLVRDLREQVLKG